MLFRLISWPYFRRHVLRTVLTTAGIVLGVALFVGMHTANQTVLGAFSQTVDRVAGKTQLQVTAGEAGFGEDVLERIQAAATVGVAVPAIEVVVSSNVRGEGNLLVLGIDMTGDRSLREYAFEGADEDSVLGDPLVFLAQPDSLIVSRQLADRNKLTPGSKLPLGTVDGLKTFTVRGIMQPQGISTAFGGNLAIMDIYAAQKMFGRGRTFDRIDLAIKEGSTIEECQAELRKLLGPGFDVQPPSSRGQQFEAMLASYSTMVSISSAFALIIGMFIIYNAFSIAVTERRTEIGILRALGATQGQIRHIFLVEGAVIGVIGSLIGLAAGGAIARGIALVIGALISDVYRVTATIDEIATSPLLLGTSFAVGVATSLVACLLPAREAARVDPVTALKKGKHHSLSARQNWVRAVAALLLAGFASYCLVYPGSRLFFYAGYFSAIAAALLLGPFLTLVLARMIRPILTRLWPVEGSLAADSLIQSPRRTSASVTALMLALALAVAFEGMGRANYASMVDWMDSTLNPDLFVLPSQSLDMRTARFPPVMAREITAVPGVERVQMVRNGRVMFRNAPTMVLGLEMISTGQTIKRPPVAGDARLVYREAAAGRGLIVSDNFARLQQVGVGDTLEISAPYGVIKLPIVGILVDYSDQQGAIMMDRSLFIKYWRDDTVNLFRVYVRDKSAVMTVRQRIINRYANRRQVFVLTNSELKSYITRVLDQWFRLTSVQIAVAVLVAVLGVINTLTVSIKDRRRELAVLQAVGAMRRQVRRTIWIEAISIGTLGLILGAALGAINLVYILDMVRWDVTGMSLDYQFPLTTVLILIPLVLSAAFIAAIWPAESAVREKLVEALEYE